MLLIFIEPVIVFVGPSCFIDLYPQRLALGCQQGAIGVADIFQRCTQMLGCRMSRKPEPDLMRPRKCFSQAGKPMRLTRASVRRQLRQTHSGRPQVRLRQAALGDINRRELPRPFRPYPRSPLRGLSLRHGRCMLPFACCIWR